MSDKKTLDFNFFDAVQSGFMAFQNHLVDVIKANAIFAAVTGVAVALIYQIFVGDNMRLQLLIMVQQNDVFGIFMTFVFGIVLNAAITALIIVFAVRTYMQITDAKSRGVGIKLGTNDPPLFQAAEEEVLVAKFGFIRFWRLWPILLIFPLFLLTMSIIQEIAIARVRGNNVGGFQFLVTLFRVGLFAIYLWVQYRIIKFYFYLAPTAVDEGHVDIDRVKERAPTGLLYKLVLTGTFWKYFVMLLLICLPNQIYSWVFDWVMDLFDAQRRNFLGDLIYFIGRHFFYLVGAVFYVGALQVIMKGTPVATEAPKSEPSASDT